MTVIYPDKEKFVISAEVVPPEGNNPEKLLAKLHKLASLPISAFSVASNPVAKPKMSALAFANLLQQSTETPAIVHCTTRDQNRIGLQAELWGAKGLGIHTVIALTGDASSRKSKHKISTVGDVSVFDLISMARDSGLETGAVLDFRPEIDGLENEVRRLDKKVAAGSSFVVTQPVYDVDTAEKIHKATSDMKIAVIMGILPLISVRHAAFLHEKVAGISIPASIMRSMDMATDARQEGIRQSRQLLALARSLFSGACIMPPFDRFEILSEILL